MKTRGLIGMAGVAAMLAMGSSAAPAPMLMPSAPRIRSQTPDQEGSRRQRKRADAKRNAAAVNVRNRIWNARRRRSLNDTAGDHFRATVNALTNWQRNQWAKAGYPGLRQKDAEKVVAFSAARVT